MGIRDRYLVAGPLGGGKQVETLARPGIAMSSFSGPAAHALPPLVAHVVSTSAALCSGLARIAETGAAGPFQSEFSALQDGIDPFLAPGIDAHLLDIGVGGPAVLQSLLRVSSLAPDSPVAASGTAPPALPTGRLAARP